MSDHRRSHQCHKNGCDSEARWQLYVRFVSKTPQRNLIPMTGESSMKVCPGHRQWACEWFLSDRQLDRFADCLERENLGAPHPENIQFEFRDLHNRGEHLVH